ncbi:WLM domain-containing protein [Thermothelomyces heterothallicus CBS 202.75]|uniref:WLM domain-containing protein n=1 Tax=Thermothelomyces heterothallicus CBS 202.75 TaxID=1149848 RepID=UPI00374207A3
MPRETNPLISSYTHLKELPRENEALDLLKRLAALVKPIMRARGWKVKTLSEMYPPQADLWGLNIDRSHILIRLRHPHDCTQFLPFEKLVDTLLHELCHLVHGPHDRKFNALWDELREELECLMMKGYTGDSFSGQGRRLGGEGNPPSEARRLPRPGSERRRPALGFKGVRLGGAAPARDQSLRDAILESLARRGHDVGRNCANDRPQREIQAISEAWLSNGFRTKAEEDEANDAAIAQALWELEQEERRKYGRPPPVPVASRPPPPPRPGSPELRNYWTCTFCTLRNPTVAAKCNACESPRPAGNLARGSFSEIIDLTGSPPRETPKPLPPSTATAPPVPQRPKCWKCSFCGNVMEHRWWTCPLCGKMKESS